MSVLKISNIYDNRLYLENIETNYLLLGKLSESVYKKSNEITINSTTSITISNAEKVYEKILEETGIPTIIGVYMSQVVVGGVFEEHETYEYMAVDSYVYDSATQIITITTPMPIGNDFIVAAEKYITMHSIGIRWINDTGFATTSLVAVNWVRINNVVVVKSYSQDKSVYRRIRSISLSEDTSSGTPVEYYTVKYDRRITEEELDFTDDTSISLAYNNFGNVEGQVERDNMGNDLTSLSGVSFQILYECIDYISESTDTFLLLYDRMESILTGTISTTSGSSVIIGYESLFLSELKKGDVVLIQGKTYTIDTVHNNIRITLTKQIITSNSNLSMYKTSDENSNIESLVSGVFIYDIKDYNSIALKNCVNVISLRNGRSLYYAFGAKRMYGNSAAYGSNLLQITDADILASDTVIHKLWINGSLVNSNDYSVVDGKIVVDGTLPCVNYFSNEYIYIKYSNSTKAGDENNYAVLGYYAFNTNYITESEYLETLHEFRFFENFSENMSYSYTDIKNNYTQEKYSFLSDRSNSITFSSAIGRYSDVDDDFDAEDKLSIIDSMSMILNKTDNFRIIRYVESLDRYVIYLNCKLRNPENETVGTDYDKVSYVIDFTYKMIISNRLFGNEDWGTFSPFGMKMKSDLII